MALKTATAMIAEAGTTFDPRPVSSAEGRVVWADVWIDFALSGMCPTVTIRVAIPWDDFETFEQRKDKALCYARQLLERTCWTLPVAHDGAGSAEGLGGKAEEAISSSVLADLVRELGLKRPTILPSHHRQPTK